MCVFVCVYLNSFPSKKFKFSPTQVYFYYFGKKNNTVVSESVYRHRIFRLAIVIFEGLRL